MAARARTAAPLLALATGLLLALATPARAVEVYSLLDRQCGTHTGLIVHVDAQQVFLLNLDGDLAVVPRAAVHRVLVFNTLDNPIPRLNFTGGLGALTRDVHLVGTDGPSYVGWPIRFQENAIIFLDIDGKTHVEDVERVEVVREASGLPAEKLLPGAVQRTFLPGPNLAECPHSSAGTGEPISPTRIISDSIKISRFLAAYDAGFTELDRFRRRSAFYARPFLYEPRTKVALSLSDFPNFESPELPALLPLYFQWSTGSSYSSQGLIVLGSKPVEWLPNVEPLFAIRSEVKSSFFSASFVGNPLALSVGRDFIVENRFAYSDFFSRFGANEILVVPHLNHMAMTGFDWGAYSVALGYYYPVIGILAGDIFRELVSPSPSIAYRLLHTGETTRLRALYSRTDLGSNNPSTDEIRIVTAGDMREASGISPESFALQDALESFRLRSEFARVGLDLELRNELEVGIDQVRFWGEYRETYPGESLRLKYEHWVTSLHGFQRFGDFVALRGYLNHFKRDYTQTQNGASRSPSEQAFSITVAIEFVL